MASAGLSGSYVRIECEAAGFATLVGELRTGDRDGFNVTMPRRNTATRHPRKRGRVDRPTLRPGSTPAVALAHELQIPSVDGFRFLDLQAAESFLWWTGHEIDVAVMEATARKG